MVMDVIEIVKFKMDGIAQEAHRCQKVYVKRVPHQKLSYK